MSQYSKNLAGVGEKVIVGTATYTAQTTYNAFLTSAAEGEVGVFLDSGAVRTTALTAGLKFFIAQKRDGNTNKTPILGYDDIYRKLRTAYAAPVKQIQAIADYSFLFTGASSTNTLTYSVQARDLTPGNQPFPVQEGYATVNSTTADEYTVLAAIVSQMNATLDYENVVPDRFVRVEVTSSSTVVALGQTAAVTQGSTSVTAGAAVTLAAGSFVSLAGGIYKVPTAVSASTAIIIDRPYEGVTATLASGTGAGQASTLAYTSGTTVLGVRATAISTDTIFKLTALGQGLESVAVTTTTAWLQGSGAGAQILALEGSEGIIFDGIGSTRNVAFREDYGTPTLFGSAALTYDQIFLDFKPSITPGAALPFYTTQQIQRVLIACPVGGTLNSTLQTVFTV